MRRLFSALAQAPPALTQTFKSRLSFDACTSTDVDRLEAEAHRLACYAGFDPTSDRLHLGNLLQIVSLVRSSMHGFTPIYLLGGATGMIGDPSGKSSERNLLETALLEANKVSVSKNLRELEASIRSHLTSNADRYGLTRELPAGKQVDNLDFYRDMNVLSYLSQIGKHVRVSTLLNRESVASRLHSQEGISYTEFSYQLLQAYDFLQLHRQHNCVLQLGGSDQWGNILSGVELVRKIDKQTVYGLTTPLLTTAEGKKFGKSEGNAIWASNDSESLLGVFQYIVNLTDDIIEPLLYKLTFLRGEEIAAIVEENSRNPDSSYAKVRLAKELITYISASPATAEKVANYSKYFSLDLAAIDRADPGAARATFASMLNVHHVASSSLPPDATVLDLVRQTGIRPSTSQAIKLVRQQALRVNEQKVEMHRLELRHYRPLAGALLVIRAGKKEYHTIILN